MICNFCIIYQHFLYIEDRQNSPVFEPILQNFLGNRLTCMLKVGNFCDQNTGEALHEVFVQVFLRFSDSSKSSQSENVSWLYCTYRLDLLESENLRKLAQKLHVKLLLSQKLPTYYDEVTTIKNNQQVRVNVRTEVFATFCIGGGQFP